MDISKDLTKYLSILSKFNIKYLYAIIIIMAISSLYSIYSTFKFIFRWFPYLLVAYFIYMLYRKTQSENFTKYKNKPMKKRKSKRKSTKRINRKSKRKSRK